MYKIKVIKTEEDYQEAMDFLENLMLEDPDPDSEKGEQLALLTTLIQDYESRIISESFVDPVEAIKFRMDQENLKPVDLVPYIGSKSRVSEILSGKRQLSLEMIRALSDGLKIPAKSLINKKEIRKADENNEEGYNNWDNKLLKEMNSYNYFGDNSFDISDKVNLLKSFFSVKLSPCFNGMMRKTNSSYRLSYVSDKSALTAWYTRVLQRAEKIETSKKYTEGLVDLDFMQSLARLSAEENGGIFLVQEKLRENGIKLVVEPHLSKTYLDGATILLDKDCPVIGLTLRYDRLDNFWFTLMHELAHLSLHYNKDINIFYDELQNEKIEINDMEKEADSLAEEALLPQAKWETSTARIISTLLAVENLAKELGVHKAIVAGQIRHKAGYKYLNKIVNQEKVRNYFPDINWKK